MLTLPQLQAPPRRTRLARVVGFVRPYLVALAGTAFLVTVGWVARHRRAQIVQLAKLFGYDHASREPWKLPVVRAGELACEREPLVMRAVEATNGNVSERELIVINGIVRSTRPRRLFEFGTFDGRTTLNLAANAPEGARVLTLDLPRSQRTATAWELDPHELVYVEKSESGQRYRGTDLEGAIVQLYGDSGSFDFGALEGTMDFVFVDASHAYEYVVNDSLHALRLLGDGGGVVLWHDYGRWDGVTRALNDLRDADPRFEDLGHIEGTTLAVLRVPASR